MNTEQSSIHIRNQPVLRLTDKLARVCFRYAVNEFSEISLYDLHSS